LCVFIEQKMELCRVGTNSSVYCTYASILCVTD